MIRLYRLVLLATLPASAGVREAVAYLSEEVPRWKRENGCFSCHNNGDAFRALVEARRAGIEVDGEPLRETIEWLGRPAAWDAKPLARVQYGTALLSAIKAGLAQGREALEETARLLAADQSADGHWQVDEELAPGSPVTYGPVLGTYLARAILTEAGAAAYQSRIRRADEWLAARRPEHPVDSAAIVLARSDPQAVERLLKTQTASGSWNSEVFDTAIVLMALAGRADCAPCREAIQRGRRFLLSGQLDPGGWTGTTRPAGGPSYAQHISTSAWALMALLATQPKTESSGSR